MKGVSSVQQLLNFFVILAQNFDFSVFCRIVYAIGVLFFFVKGEISVSKFAQTFSNLEQRFMLSGQGTVIEKPELDDCQAEINSHKDDSIGFFLDKYLPEITKSSPLCDIDDSDYEVLDELIGSCKADRILAAYEGIQNLRVKYNVPDHFSNEEVVTYIKSQSEQLNNSLNTEKGGVSDEKTQNVEESEQA